MEMNGGKIRELTRMAAGFGFRVKIWLRDFSSFPIQSTGNTCLRPGNYFEINLSDKLSDPESLRVFCHELGHIYCGHPHEELPLEIAALDASSQRFQCLLDTAKLIDTEASRDEKRDFENLLNLRQRLEMEADTAGRMILSGLYKRRSEFTVFSETIATLHDQETIHIPTERNA
jgi:hypothetical protein